MARKHDLFLSYNSRDHDGVRRVHEDLKRLGFHPWFDREALTPGRLWQEEAEKGLKSCRAAAVFFGPNGLGPWENLEMRALLNRVAKEGLPLIPVALPGAPEKLQLPAFLAELTWVDMRKGIAPDGIAELARGIPAKKRKKRSSKPPDKPDSLGPPRLHNLPPALGDWLKGRDNELRALAASLEGGGPTAIVQKHRALYGLGGIGKTRLAVEYAWRFGSRYTAAFLVRADSPEGLRTGLATLARADLLDLPERNAKAEEETVHAVVRWLKDHPGWLLILDNVDTKEAEVAVLAFLESLTGGHVLITSRLRDWPRNRIHTQVLGTIPLDEARDFLLKRTDGDRRPEPDDAERARDLAEKLDGLPLALEQAGAYIVHTRISFSEYLEVWEEERQRVLEWYDEAVMSYPASVAATWQRSFDRLKPTAATLLRLCAFLAPDPIPEEMFESNRETVHQASARICTETKQESDGSSIPEALAELESYSLIARHGGTFTVHRVVQEVVQSRISPERRKDWLAASLQVMDDYSPETPSDVQTWPVWNLLRAHATALLRRAEELDMASLPQANLTSKVGVLLWAKGLYAEAEPLMRRALGINEKAGGPDHPAFTTDLNNLARLLLDTDRRSEAEPLMRRALAIDEKAFGHDHPRVASHLNNLVDLLKAEGCFREAESLMRRALAIDENAFESDPLDVARDLSNLAQLLKAEGRLAEAEPLMRRALEIEESFRDDHPRVAVQLNNLARLLQATARLPEAECLMRRAVEILERKFGPEHPHTQRGQKNLEDLLEEVASQKVP